MDTGPDGRRRVDLSRLPAWGRWLAVLATIAVVVGIALLVRRPHGGLGLPVSAFVAALIDYSAVAWAASHRR